MNDDLRAVRTLIFILLASGLLRLGWQARNAAVASGAGTPVDLALALDSAERVEADEARRTAPLAEGETLELNSAPAAELDRLPGVGPATAQRIVLARADRPFQSVDDLGRVSGIGPATLAKLRPYLRVDASGATGRERPGPAARTVQQGQRTERGGQRLGGGPAPGTQPAIDPNLASASQLQALPGIGPSLADRWIQHRRSHGPFRSQQDLLGIPGIGPATLERLKPGLKALPWAARVSSEAGG